jgi:hypothetical protein
MIAQLGGSMPEMSDSSGYHCELQVPYMIEWRRAPDVTCSSGMNSPVRGRASLSGEQDYGREHG